MKKIFLLAILLGAPLLAHAGYEDEPEPSTAPIGSSFYRHLAFDMNLDLRELVKFEKRGFGRGEIITLILISKATGTPLKDYGKRRMKDQVSLRDLAAEAKLDYDTLYKNVRAIKEGIEAQGDSLLPPPIFETPATDTDNKEKPKKKEPSSTTSPAPDAKPAPTPTTTTPVSPPKSDPSQTELE